MKVEDECDLNPKMKVKDIPNPQSVYPEIKEILISRCSISPNDINEDVYEHKKGTPEKIHIILKASKQKDKYTSINYKLDINMNLRRINKKEIKFVGDIDIEISGKVETVYPQKTALQKSILWDAFRGFYEKVIYGDLKDEYMESCKKSIIKLRDGIQSYFNLLPKMT